MAELVHNNPHGQVIAYHCCQADTQETLQPWRFVRSIAAVVVYFLRSVNRLRITLNGEQVGISSRLGSE